jgi:hypothetical protein
MGNCAGFHSALFGIDDKTLFPRLKLLQYSDQAITRAADNGDFDFLFPGVVADLTYLHK